MSALLLRRRREHDLLDDWAPCANGCYAHYSAGAHQGYKVALWQVELLGHPVVRVCEECKEGWRRAWEGAGGRAAVVESWREPAVEGVAA